jgi:MFS family permease
MERPAMPVGIALDWINFFLADVRGAFGPYLNIYLLTQQHWAQGEIGLVLTVGGIASLLVQTPVGAWIDATRAKRAAVTAAVAVLAAATVIIALFPSFWTVLVGNTLMAVVGDVFGPAVAAITLGIIGHKGLARRLGRNSAFDHAGNVAIALLAGAVGWWISERAVFFLMPVFAVLVAFFTLSIPASAIDHARARGSDRPDGGGEHVSDWKVLVACRPLVILGVCAVLFHFANAPLLPLVGQELALHYKGDGAPLMSACVIAGQAVMLPLALLVGWKADSWGRKPIFLAAFAILPVRAFLMTLSANAFWLVGLQLLDGVGAGIFGAVVPLILADLMRGTGRYNASQGFVATLQGVGASLSNVVAGYLVQWTGYSPTYLVLGGVACAAFLVFLLFMPETKQDAQAPVAVAPLPAAA